MGSSSSKFKKYLQHGDEYAAMQVYQNSGELRRWVIYYTNVWHLGYPNSSCYPNTRAYIRRLPESVKFTLLFVIVFMEVAIFNEKNLIFLGPYNPIVHMEITTITIHQCIMRPSMEWNISLGPSSMIWAETQICK